MIERFHRALGLRLPLWKGRQVEVWFFPKGESAPAHQHTKIESFIVALWGRQRWTVQDKVRDVFGPFRRRRSNGRIGLSARRIGCGVRHAFTALTFSVFVNFERCLGPRVSAAEDFVLVP